ncbi:MAG: hypothetical protein H7Y03_03450 [Chitinophagaceae bacterium]|nr:hypothetical protein [Chitinophagaceae bacterium]
MKLLSTACLLLLLASCVRITEEEGDNMANVMAYDPVYRAIDTISTVTIEGKRSTVKAGKIYAYGNYIFQNELNEGIHIIDNSNTAQPVKIAFLRIPMNTEMAMKGNYLYANNHDDLLIIDVGDPSKPSLLRKIENVFPLINQQYPPQSGRFVCPDLSKGVVVDWVLRKVPLAKCLK